MGFCEALEPKDDPPEDLDRTDDGFRCIFNSCCRSNGGAVEERTARVKVPVPSELLVPSGDELILMCYVLFTLFCLLIEGFIFALRLKAFLNFIDGKTSLG